MFELLFELSEPPVITTQSYQDSVWGARKTVRTSDAPAEVLERVIADTPHAMTVSEMAQRFDDLGTLTLQNDAELSVDPDDYSLF